MISRSGQLTFSSTIKYTMTIVKALSYLKIKKKTIVLNFQISYWRITGRRHLHNFIIVDKN